MGAGMIRPDIIAKRSHDNATQECYIQIDLLSVIISNEWRFRPISREVNSGEGFSYASCTIYLKTLSKSGPNIAPSATCDVEY